MSKIDLSPWSLTPEQRAELDAFHAENVANGTARPRVCEVAPVPQAAIVKPVLSQEAQAWIDENQWVNQQPTRFTRTHFRPSVLRRGRVR